MSASCGTENHISAKRFSRGTMMSDDDDVTDVTAGFSVNDMIADAAVMMRRQLIAPDDHAFDGAFCKCLSRITRIRSGRADGPIAFDDIVDAFGLALHEMIRANAALTDPAVANAIRRLAPFITNRTAIEKCVEEVWGNIVAAGRGRPN